MEATVIPGTIERDIVIEAPVEAIWRAVTQPGQISRWFTDSAQIDLHPNGTGTLVWDGRATNQPATVHLHIVTIEPPRTFSLRWLHRCRSRREQLPARRVHAHPRGRTHAASPGRERAVPDPPAERAERGVRRAEQQGLGHSPRAPA